MKFLRSLSLLAFAGVFSCRAHQVKGPVSFKDGSLTFYRDFMFFNLYEKDEVGYSKFHLSGLDTPGQLPVGVELTLAQHQKYFHWDKEKICIPGKTKTEAWIREMICVHLFNWFRFFDAVHGNKNIKPVIPPSKEDNELYEAILHWKKLCDPDARLDDREEAFEKMENCWSKLLRDGKMYVVREESGLVRDGQIHKYDGRVFSVPDEVIITFVLFLTECHLHPGKITGPGEEVGDLSQATVSNYVFDDEPPRRAAADTPALEELRSSINAPRSGAPPSLSLFSVLAESSQEQKEWAALIARSRAPKTSCHRVLIAMAVLAIFALVLVVYLCSRTKTQDVARFDDLDAIVNVV